VSKVSVKVAAETIKKETRRNPKDKRKVKNSFLDRNDFMSKLKYQMAKPHVQCQMFLLPFKVNNADPSILLISIASLRILPTSVSLIPSRLESLKRHSQYFVSFALLRAIS